MSNVVIFTARCPKGHPDARWTQHSQSNAVKPSDFTIRCSQCASRS